MKRNEETKLVFTNQELIEVSESEILKTLEEFQVTRAKRITKRVGNTRVNTPTVILTFNGEIAPTLIPFNDTELQLTDLHIKPLVCFNCLQIGHTRKACRSTEKICYNCSKGMHADSGTKCTFEKFCGRCGESSHSIADKTCPKYKSAQKSSQITVYNKNQKPSTSRKTSPNPSEQQVTMNSLQSFFDKLRKEFLQLTEKIETIYNTLNKKLDTMLNQNHTANEEDEHQNETENSPALPVVPDNNQNPTPTEPLKKPHKKKKKRQKQNTNNGYYNVLHIEDNEETEDKDENTVYITNENEATPDTYYIEQEPEFEIFMLEVDLANIIYSISKTRMHLFDLRTAQKEAEHQNSQIHSRHIEEMPPPTTYQKAIEEEEIRLKHMNEEENRLKANIESLKWRTV